MMWLLYIEPSPFSRKVRAFVEKNGLSDKLSLVRINPYAKQSELLEFNALGQVPVLLYKDEESKMQALSGSNLVVEFLREHFIGTHENLTFSDRNILGKVDGAISAAVSYAVENKKPKKDEGSIDRQVKKIESVLSEVNQSVNEEPRVFQGLAGIALVSFLDYLSLRAPEIRWQGYVSLLQWYAAFSQLDFLRDTQPTKKVADAVDFEDRLQIEGFLANSIWSVPNPEAMKIVEKFNFT